MSHVFVVTGLNLEAAVSQRQWVGIAVANVHIVKCINPDNPAMQVNILCVYVWQQHTCRL